MIDYEGSWDRHIPLVEFVYNNNFQSSIGMTPYEALYGRKCRTPLYWIELSEKKVIGPDLIQETEEKVKMIRERLKVANDRQKSYADMKRKDIRYEIGEKVFLKVSPWKKVMRFGKKGKLRILRLCGFSRMPRNWENELLLVIAKKRKSFCSITMKLAWGATIYHLWGHRNSRIQENNYTPADTIFLLICDNVRLRISGLQKVADTPANRAMCERWSFPLNILAPGRFTA